jgi:hypothetical protein
MVMIRALLLDLGGTLMVEGIVLPGVPDALRVLQTLESADAKPLIMCLVSDYAMPEPRTPQAIESVFQEYLAVIERANLRQFFEPVEERVTLSTHAGVMKPDRRVFEMALKRAELKASIEEALFITEDAGHVTACRNMGMTALQFGVDFDDWTNAPLLVARTIDSSGITNVGAALKQVLAADHDVRLDEVESISGGGVRGKGRSWVKLDAPELGSLRGVHVELPVDVEAKIGSAGGLTDVRVTPSPEYLAEAVQNVQTLVSNQQVSEAAATANSPVVPTHTVETDDKGRRLLRRRRFTAF